MPDGVRLWFEAVGTGAQVLVLPNGFPLLEDFRRLAEGGRRTLVFYDVRNRGRSDMVTDPTKLERGVHNDVDDLEAVRRHFGLGRLILLGHSYVGLTVVLYGMKFPAHTDRIVQIGAMGPDPRKQHPPELTGNDGVLQEVRAQIAAVPKGGSSCDPADYCRKVWNALRRLYVADPKDADRIRWDRCDLPNERDFMRYLTTYVMPSIHALALTPETLAAVTAPVLTIHGRRDRSAPYGGALDWTRLLPNARLVSVPDAAHAPWIEAPDLVFGAIEEFLAG